jgi:hypothetical protein
VTTHPSPRQTITLNRDWKFHLGEAPAAHLPTFNDSQWSPVGLPHTFDLPYFRTPEFYVGQGWYRKQIDISLDWIGKRKFLEFEGAFQVAHVFINGTHVGRHEGGYTGFCIEITDALTPGPNTLAIRVDNSWNAQLAPRAGEHIFSGGLYRDVRLIVTDPVHFTWHGITVTTPAVSHSSATVQAKCEISNQSPDPRRFKLVATMKDPGGLVVASSAEHQAINPGQTIEISQLLPPISNPQLWHPDHPHLYTARLELLADDSADSKLIDTAEIPLGLRFFQWTADRGFFLNGQHLYLRGANAHQDHAGWGIAITQAACYRDVKLIKEAGFNFVRGAHYPHHPAFADACDRLGLIFWSEACFWGKGGFGPEGYWNAPAYPVHAEDREPFEQSCLNILTEMIRINRNHPSILVWSMTNEAFFTYDLDRTRKLMTRMVDLSHKLDPTRPAAVGGCQRGGVDKLGDIAGYNGDGARLFINPGIPNMVSEYGAISKPVDAYDPFFGDLQAEHFPWRAGEAIWCGFDYGSIAGKQGLKGILQHNRLPKQSWHWYRNHNLGIPSPTPPTIGTPARLHISADKSTLRGTDGTDDCQIIVTVCDAAGNHIANSPPVTLAIESGPGEFPTGRRITFDPQTDITIALGQAAVALRSYHAGVTLLRASSPGLADATFSITTHGEPRYIEGQTPPVPDRPYTPPQLAQAAITALNNVVNVARDRPTLASSECGDHPARFANDADAATFWQAAARTGEPATADWLRIDLEGFYQLSDCRLLFASADNYRYRIDLSLDETHWQPAIDRSQTIRTDAKRHDVFDPGTIARYVRITFTELPAGVSANLCEFELHGVLSSS